MPRIAEIIQRIRESTDVVEIVSEYVQLKKSGRNYTGLCPFHEEKTPSFSVNPALQIYKCFGCDAGGNVFKFLQEMDRISFVEAVSFLAKRSNIPLPTTEADNQQNEASDLLYRANELARKYYHYMLYQESGQSALAYARNRGLTDETIERFELGYAPAGWDGLIKIAAKRQLRSSELEKAGLASPRQQGHGHYDRFRDRLIFPIANISGRTIAFGARALQADQEPKYLNSPETPIYRKSAVLYGLDQAREAIRQRGVALVVEGYMDLISLVQHGVDHVVASSGTALTEEHCRILARYAQRVVLIFDGDAAGSAAALRGLEVLLSSGLESNVVSLPGDHDPDTFVRQQGTPALEEAIDRADSALDFLLEQTARHVDLNTLSGKAQAVEAVKPMLVRCQDAVRRDLLLREVSQRLHIDERALRQDLQQSLSRGARRPGVSQTEKPAALKAALPAHEQSFLGLLLNFPQYIGPTAEQLGPEHFVDHRAQHLTRILFAKHRDATTLDLALLINDLQSEETAHIVTTCAMEGFEESLQDQWNDYILYFRQDTLTRQIDQCRQVLGQAAEAGDENSVQQISTELRDLVKARQEMATQQSS